MPIKDKTILIYGNGGTDIPLAVRLAREFKIAGYFSPWTSGYCTVNDLMAGSGFDGVERIKDFWQATDKFDVIAFFDVHTADIADYLKRAGKAVFAPGRAETLETERWTARKLQASAGLPTQKTEHITGLTKLIKRLEQVKNKYVKISVFRGEIETFYHKDFESSQIYLNKLAVSLGINKDEVKFIVEDKIDGGTEFGFDGFVVDGKYPNYCMQGWEVKDKSYIGKVVKYQDLFNPVKTINDKLSPFFDKNKTRSMFSTEVKIKDGKGWLIDPTVRAPLPPSFVEMEIYENFGEFVYNAALGKMIDLKPLSVYGAEVIMDSPFNRENPLEVTFPKEIERWVKLAGGCKKNGKYYILPGDDKTHYISVVALGNTVDEVLANAKNTIGKVGAFQLQNSFDKQAILDKITEGKTAGIKF